MPTLFHYGRAERTLFILPLFMSGLLLFTLTLTDASVLLLNGLLVVFGGTMLFVYRHSLQYFRPVFLVLYAPFLGLLSISFVRLILKDDPVIPTLIGSLSPLSSIALLSLFGFALLGILVCSRGERFVVSFTAVTAFFLVGIATTTFVVGVFFATSLFTLQIAGGVAASSALLLVAFGINRASHSRVFVLGILALLTTLVGLASSPLFVGVIIIHILFLLGGLFLCAKFQESRRPLRFVLPFFISSLFVFLLINQSFTPVSQIRYTISYADSLRLVNTVYLKNTSSVFLGEGQFEHVWDAYRPHFVSSTPLWSSVIKTSDILLIDTLVSHGVLGAFFLLSFPATILLFFIRYRKKLAAPSLGLFLAASTAAWFFVLGPPSMIFAALAFFWGICFVSYCLKTSNPHNTKSRFSFVGIFIGTVVLFFGFGYTVELSLLAHAKDDGAVSALFLLSRILPHDDVSRFLAESKQKSVVEKIQTGENIDDIVADSDEARMYAEIAVALNDIDMKNLLIQGSVYAQRTIIGVSDNSEETVSAFRAAGRLAPNSPIPPFLLGQFFVGINENEKAREELKKALLLRPNYSQAKDLYEKITSSSYDI